MRQFANYNRGNVRSSWNESDKYANPEDPHIDDFGMHQISNPGLKAADCRSSRKGHQRACHVCQINSIAHFQIDSRILIRLAQMFSSFEMRSLRPRVACFLKVRHDEQSDGRKDAENDANRVELPDFWDFRATRLKVLHLENFNFLSSLISIW